jgi:hypothetical protein
MPRRVSLAIVLGVLVIAFGLAGRAYLSGAASLLAQIVSLLLVGGILISVISVNGGDDYRAADVPEWFASMSAWKIIYCVSVVVSFFGLWVLTNLYLSKGDPIFPHSFAGPALIGSVVGIGLFLVASWRLNKRGD